MKSSLNILKNTKKISEKYNQIQSQRKYSDKEILDFFHDEIQVPKWVVSEMSNTLFNNFLNNLSKITRRFI